MIRMRHRILLEFMFGIDAVGEAVVIARAIERVWYLR